MPDPSGPCSGGGSDNYVATSVTTSREGMTTASDRGRAQQTLTVLQVGTCSHAIRLEVPMTSTYPHFDKPP